MASACIILIKHKFQCDISPKLAFFLGRLDEGQSWYVFWLGFLFIFFYFLLAPFNAAKLLTSLRKEMAIAEAKAKPFH